MWLDTRIVAEPQNGTLSYNEASSGRRRSYLCEKAQRIMSSVPNKPVSSPVLIGRQVEVATLHALIDQARKGQGQVILLSGEAGVSKSRLAAEVKTQAQAHGFLV